MYNHSNNIFFYLSIENFSSINIKNTYFLASAKPGNFQVAWIGLNSIIEHVIQNTCVRLFIKLYVWIPSPEQIISNMINKFVSNIASSIALQNTGTYPKAKTKLTINIKTVLFNKGGRNSCFVDSFNWNGKKRYNINIRFCHLIIYSKSKCFKYICNLTMEKK